MASTSAMEKAKSSFNEMFSQFGSDEERRVFLDWIAREISEKLPLSHGQQNSSEIQYRKITDSRNILTRVSSFIKNRCIPEASNKGNTSNGSVWHSEKLNYPSKFEVGGDADEGLTAENTIHLDSFLYDEADEDAMIDSGVLSRAFCKACGSKDTEEIVYVTHSCSKNTLEYIFRSILPPLNVNHMVLDVGSRLGAVLYGAYLFSGAGKIIGIELNNELCELQNHVIQTFGFSDRASILHAEMTTRPDVFALADVIILNNVFEWFVEAQYQGSMWQFLYNNIKVGALIVTMPSMEKATNGLSLGITLEDWIRPIDRINNDITDSLLKESDIDIYLYQVISKPTAPKDSQRVSM